MKLFEKYLKRPQSKEATKSPETKTDKQPQAKDMLLQTYFTSLLSLLLCVTMFLGTSYAWFTSEVNNPTNEIYVGTLKVGLLKEANSGVQDMAEADVKLFDKNIRWEPGYTAVETIHVVNKGDLAFKYVLTFTDGTLANANGKSLGDVAKYFDVWVFDHLNKTYEKPTSYAAITTDANWVKVGTLAEVLEGKTVLSGNMTKVRKEGQDAAAINEGTTDGESTVNKFTIALHMNEMANSEVMGQKINLNVKLVAYQMVSEPDAFGNGNYDSNLMIAANAKELKEVLASGNRAVLASDVAIDDADECVNMHADMFDGNGKTITYAGEQANGSYADVLTTSGGKIANLTVNGGANGGALYVTQLTSDLVVTECALSGAYSFNLNSATKADNAIISFIDTTFASGTSYTNVAKHVYFTGCTFGGTVKPYGDTTLTNCTFTAEGLDVSALEANEVITLINCRYNGQLIEKAVLTSDGTAVTISQSSAMKVNAAELVILNSNG